MNTLRNFRIFVEKKRQFQTEAKALLEDFKVNLNEDIKSLRLINIYDVFNITTELLDKTILSVFSEVVTDNVYFELSLKDETYFAVEYLPGQFDQRADSARQLISLIDANSDARVKSGVLIIIEGNVNLNRIKSYYINKIESQEKNLSDLVYQDNATLIMPQVIDDFKTKTSKELKAKYSWTMTDEDLNLIKDYFNSIGRLPTETEIKVLETYWSDHCRHSTFLTNLEIDIIDLNIKQAFHKYTKLRKDLNRSHKPISLMDMATVNMHYEKAMNNLNDLEISDENNACSIYVDIDVDGQTEKWLLMFKNETHNHPTEIEPFGGASTCIGGAIRDPLSGRSYVYQAMRVTGSGDVRADISKTLEGKLPQRVISKKAAAGYSSYGNQIGLATNHVREIYHQGYIAKRLEVGAVVGACPLNHVKRLPLIPGDIVILLGGRTGRDGIGGATGSSKEHNDASLMQSATEVQKGNAPEERKLQRLFRNVQATRLIKKANDFGAGGVSVAIGELADGLDIELDQVPTKYKGLNAMELAISESQERMAVVIASDDVNEFLKLAYDENIEATIVAKVTDKNRLIMKYKGEIVVDLSRDFINTNGAKQYAKAKIDKIDYNKYPTKDLQGSLKEKIQENISDLNCCSQKGLVEMFDSTIGSNTVLMPYGGIYQLSPTQGAVSKFPVLNHSTNTCSIMCFGFNPFISSFSPYHGAKAAIIESMSKIVSIGGDYRRIRFTFQEYFEKLNQDEHKWGKPIASLLGAVELLEEFSLAAIGGKDSMSGTYNELNVPPTLISFAVTTENVNNIISTELKQVNNYIYVVNAKYNAEFLADVDSLKVNFKNIYNYIQNKTIISAYAIEAGGLSDAIIKMALGNKLGVNINTELNLFDYNYGSIVVESVEKINEANFIYLGKVTNGNICINGVDITHEEALYHNNYPLNKVYPQLGNKVETDLSIVVDSSSKKINKFSKSSVNVLIPVFPGTNCDYDSARAFQEVGGTTKTIVFKNLTPEDINLSIQELKTEIDKTDILVISGGFSAGDEPDGSGKFIACILNNLIIKQSIRKLIQRKGLILGICNGFQALIKSGLLPYNSDVNINSPTLVKNEINRHVSKIVKTRVTSTSSPWLSSFVVGEVHNVPISHGEGKFVIDHNMAIELFKNKQVAFQYCDSDGNASNDPLDNPNGSHYAIEGIISLDGLILGKMAHSERKGNNTLKNIYGPMDQNIFKNAIDYFTKGKNNG